MRKSKERLYVIWNGMRGRCYSPYNPSYPNYGGRGIKICNEWKYDYEKFKSWALANGYTDDLTIDRINVDGDYEPGNCRWATRVEQYHNRRKSMVKPRVERQSKSFDTIEYGGTINSLSRWCDELHLSYPVVYNRIKGGWDIVRAFETPVRQKKKNAKK